MKIYRFETEDGLGAFQGANTNEHIRAAHELISEIVGVDTMANTDWHPAPCDDPRLRRFFYDTLSDSMRKHWHFAARSIEQALRWFGKDHLAILEEAEVFLWEIEIWSEDCFIGNDQLLYDKRKVVSRTKILSSSL